MLLSIAMIVKNEEKNLDRCLKAFEKLNNEIDYEIVIIDTGSTDNTLTIARKYTDKIYEEQWNDDFSTMRNISIKKSEGQWVLILDADEVLENHKELIEFLKYKSEKYNSSIVKFKNYTANGTYVIGGLVRLFRNNNQLEYVGRVHEQPIYEKPTYMSNITFDHYGYCRNDYGLMKYKYERNLKLLLQDLEEGKENDIYTLFQLSQTYSMANKKVEALKAIEKAYDIIKDKRELMISEEYLYVHRQLAVQLFTIGNYEKVIETCENVVKWNKKFIDFYYLLAISNKNLKRNSEAEKHFEDYFRVFDDNKKGDNNYITLTDFSTSKYEEMKSERIINLYEIKKYKEIINLYENNSYNNKSTLNQIIMYSYIKESQYKKLKTIYKVDEIGDKDIEDIKTVIDRIIAEKSNIDLCNIIKNLQGIDKKLDIYIQLFYEENKIISVEYNIDYNKFYCWKADILKFKINRNIYNINELKKLNKIDLQRYLNYMLEDYQLVNILYEYDNENFLSTDMKDLNFFTILEKQLVLLDCIDEKKLENLTHRMFINNINFINKKYNWNYIDEKDVKFILDKDERFWYNINLNIKNNSMDKLKYIRKLKDILEDMSEYKKVIACFKDNMTTDSISKEMISEKDNILNEVESMISNSMLYEAEEILKELDDVFIYDVGIKNLLGVVEFLKGNSENALVNFSLVNLINNDDFESIYNIACVLEQKGIYSNAKQYYNKAYELCRDEKLKSEILEGLNKLSDMELKLC
ncbi:glycosyltransferase family 2 protein [Clostridium ihumii]|uniref:glycosyltransferase family 2 protein n=1 Tax=Clostridium ihumii TaxID=1470356 RepID=UPI00058F95C4|nr:glycosyltransferase family 2 protein [Clostridium ihumii]